MDSNHSSSGAKKILLIDDDPVIIDILSRILRPKGYEITVASDGIEALEKTFDEHPDLIILDLGLPKLPGEEVCRQIRKTEKKHHIPIIMLSGKTNDVDKIIGKVIGADHYMPKPFNIRELITLTAKFTS